MKRDLITSLKTLEGDAVNNVQSLLRETERFFGDLYSIKLPFDPETVQRLHRNVKRKVSAKEADMIKRPLSIDQLRLALSSCQCNSTAGEDGLPFEFWLLIDDLVTPLFQKALTTWNFPSPPTPFPVLSGALLFKRSDRECLENYHPISIMNSNLRWQAKVEATRLVPLLTNVISHN